MQKMECANSKILLDEVCYVPNFISIDLIRFNRKISFEMSEWIPLNDSQENVYRNLSSLSFW